jgi:hypothetical protein
VPASALLGKQPGLSGIEQKTPKTWAKNVQKKIQKDVDSKTALCDSPVTHGNK